MSTQKLTFIDKHGMSILGIGLAIITGVIGYADYNLTNGEVIDCDLAETEKVELVCRTYITSLTFEMWFSFFMSGFGILLAVLWEFGRMSNMIQGRKIT